MIVVHHLNNSRSQRVLWLLEELRVPYEVRRYERDAKTMLAPPSLRQVHPLGKSPLVVDGDVTLAESGAIVESLVDAYDDGTLRPPAGTDARRRYTYWMHYAEGSAMPPLLLNLVFGRLPKGPMPFFIRPVVRAVSDKARRAFIAPQLKTHLDWMESELAAHDWFAGDTFSAADIQMSFPVEAFAARGGLDESRPKLWGWLQRIHARPAYAKALEAGGPYEILR